MRIQAGIVVAATIGVLLAVGLTARSGLPGILEALGRLGWQGVVLVCGLQAVAILARAGAWQALVRKVGMSGCLAAQLVRDGTQSLLWMVPGLGLFAGIRTLRLFGAPTTLATASTIIDMVIESASLILIAILGVIVVLTIDGDDHTAMWLGVLGFSMLQVLAIALLPRHRGAMRFAGKLIRRAGRAIGSGGASASQELIDTLADIYAHRLRLVLSILFHLLAWGLYAAQIWVAAHAMGAELSPLAALVLVGLVFAVTGLLFVVPWGMGVQEFGFVFFGALFGIDESTALALSLSIRMRDLILGLPGALLWLVFEGRATWQRTRARVA